MRVLIVEDEMAAARRLEKMILEAEPDTEILARLESVAQTVQWLQENPAPELIFLDIHLADGSSFDIFEQVEVTSPIIFTTAFDEYALQAFKVSALHYLLKPIKTADLAEAFQKYKNLHKAVPADYAALLAFLQEKEGTGRIRRMLVRFGKSIKLINMEDAAYFYTRDKITFLVTRSTAKRYPVDHPLDLLEEGLDPNVFFRINRQFIINITAIREMNHYSKSRIKVELEPPTELETVVSTERSAEFKRWLVGERSIDDQKKNRR